MKSLQPRAAFAALIAVVSLASGLLAVHEAVAPGVAAADTTFTFEGGGWGHGVGMSQYGAKGRADAGQSAANIIAAYYTGSVLTTVAAPSVRVLLTEGAGTTVAFSAATTISGNGGPIAQIAPGESVEVKAVGGAYQLQVTGPTAKPAVAVAANDVLVAPLGGQPARVDATGNRYNNGRLVFRLPSTGTVQVTNDQLTMQQYLYGLGEVPSSWPVEALKAQALAARTYAYKRVQAPRTATYDILATTTDQVYVGYEKQAAAFGAQWVAAVDGTDNQIITYNGTPIDALYSSSNGGYSEDSEYAFVATVPYLRANADPFDNAAGNPNFRWTRSYTGTELGTWLTAARGVNIGAITAYSVSGNISRVGRIDRATVTLTGTTGTTTVTGAQLRNLVNQSAPSNRQFQSTLLFFRPIGVLDAAVVSPGALTLAGWALFQGSTAPAQVNVYVNGALAGSTTATIARPDVAGSVPGAGPNVGYNLTVPIDRASNEVCVHAVTPSGTSTTVLACRTIVVDTQPFGALDYIAPTPGGVRIGGWVMDPNLAGPTAVHVYVNGRIGAVVTAANPRPDVAASYPAYGPNHGFDISFPVDSAVNTVCAYGINAGPGDNVLLGCRVITNSVQPTGSIDVISSALDGITVAGWAFDPDTADPIDVHVYVDGVGRAVLRADGARPDVGAAFPGYGANHGFFTKLAPMGGTHSVCLYAINVRAGDNQMLGCRTVTLPVQPFGSIDLVSGDPTGITVAGWTIDADNVDPIDVHVYVDGVGRAVLRADGARPDVGAAAPGYGPDHGFTGKVAAGGGLHQVCLYAINTRAGDNVLLGCRNALVPADPFGSVDVVKAGADGIRVSGWAIDPNTSDPIDVHVYVGTTGVPISAAVERPDVAASFPGAGALHGFDAVVPGRAGQTVCIYAINVGPGGTRTLACRTATA